jgi:hypothetical protein
VSGRRAHVCLRIAAPALVVVTVAVLARADAPPGQYAAFNRANTVITDVMTGLNWQRTVMQYTTFDLAVAACNGLSLGTFSSKWRLPSYKELLTLVDEAPHTEYPAGTPLPIAIDGNAFPETAVDYPYWTSSVVPNTTTAFTVNFETGEGGTSQLTTPLYVRCVNDGM